MTYQNTTALTDDQIQALTAEMNAWMEATGRQRFPRAKQDELLEMGAKRCSRCTEVLLLDDFGKHAKEVDGLRSDCRACKNGGHRERYRNDPEFREQLLEYKRERRTDEEYRQREREYMRDRYRTDELHRLRAQLDDGYRRAIRAGVQADWVTAEQILTYWNAKGIPALECIYTGEELTPWDRSVDHATPISRGGGHTVENLVPSSWEANDRKKSKTATEFVIARSEASDLDDFDNLPEDVRRALEPQAPARKKRIVEINLEAIKD